MNKELEEILKSAEKVDVITIEPDERVLLILKLPEEVEGAIPGQAARDLQQLEKIIKKAGMERVTVAILIGGEILYIKEKQR